MTLGHSPKIVTNGLVFAYDMHQSERGISKSYKGKPTTNYAWAQNPRIDSSYVPYVNTTSGTWPQKHYDAITVYNKGGSNISAYVNGGVTDYTNTYHAHWIFDGELRKPVVIMRNLDGNQWKAKYFSLGKTYTQMGLNNGDTYTISWLQWTDNINRSANAGLYGQNQSATNGFHDGLSNGISTSYNTKSYTWERVYATFTVSATNSTETNRSCYMYGQYGGAGILKIADVQIEIDGPSGFLYGNSEANSTRSNTQSLLDWTGNNTITANSLTYNADGTFSFNGSSNVITFPENSALNSQTVSVEVWAKTNATTQNGFWFEKGNVNTQYSLFQEGGSIRWRANFGSGLVNMVSPTTASFINTTDWFHIVATFVSGQQYVYINGNQVGSNTLTGTITTNANGCSIGAYGGFNGSRGYYYNGDIGVVKVYNRALTAAEVSQNYNALRGRYGL